MGSAGYTTPRHTNWNLLSREAQDIVTAILDDLHITMVIAPTTDPTRGEGDRQNRDSGRITIKGRNKQKFIFDWEVSHIVLTSTYHAGHDRRPHVFELADPTCFDKVRELIHD